MLNKFGFWIIVVVTFCVPLFFSPLTPEDPFLLPKKTLLSFLACVVIIVIFLPVKRLLQTFSDTIFLSALLLLTCFAVSIPLSINIHAGFAELKRWACLLTLFLVTTQLEWFLARIRLLFKTGMIASGIIASYTIIEYAGVLPFYPCPLEEDRLYSFFGYQNILAQYLIIAVLWNIGFVTSSSKLTTKITGTLCAILSTAALLLTFCRGAILSTILGFIFFLLLYRLLNVKKRFYSKNFSKPAFKKIIFTVVILFTIFIPSTISLSEKKTDYQKLSQNLSSMIKRKDNLRFILWRDSVDMFSSNPVRGVGLGNYYINYPLYKTGNWKWLTVYAHNEPLHLISETGIIGLCGIIVFFIVVIIQIRRTIRYSDPKIKPLLIALASGCVGTLIHSQFSYNFHSSAASSLFFISLGLLCSKKWQQVPKTEICQQRHNMKNIILVCPVIIVSLWGMYDEYKNMIGHYYYNRALSAINNKEKVECIKYSLKAISYQPYNAKYHRLLGSVYKNVGETPLAEKHFKKAALLMPYHH